MTLKPRKPMYNKTISLDEALYQRWIIYAALTGRSFNRVCLEYLEQTLPHLDAHPEQKEERP
jgi:hypothetical protein